MFQTRSEWCVSMNKSHNYMKARGWTPCFLSHKCLTRLILLITMVCRGGGAPYRSIIIKLNQFDRQFYYPFLPSQVCDLPHQLSHAFFEKWRELIQCFKFPIRYTCTRRIFLLSRYFEQARIHMDEMNPNRKADGYCDCAEMIGR